MGKLPMSTERVSQRLQSPESGKISNADHIVLWPKGAPHALGDAPEDQPIMTYFPVKSEVPSPAMIVLPGGGYEKKVEREGEPIARWLNGLGIAAFVLQYRVAPYRHPVPLQDAQRAIRLLRSEAGLLNLDPQRIGVLGFSAGGHLASCVGTHFDMGRTDADDPVERMSSRPDLMVLCYPVISFKTHAHEGSKSRLLGGGTDESLVQHLSSEMQVTSDTPPAFIWHAADDRVVPAENSLMMAASLARYRVPYDLHIFESGSGRHGFGLGADHLQIRQWTELCAVWLRLRSFIR